MKNPLLLLLALVMFACAQQPEVSVQSYNPEHELLRYAGRIDFANPAEPVLIGSASSVSLSFSGDSCRVYLKKLNVAGEHNYVSLELDGQYLGRLKLDNSAMQPYIIRVPDSAKNQQLAGNTEATHILKVLKATEAQNGNIAFGGVQAQELHQMPAAPGRSIEFIGNSITCGMGIDWKEVPCDSGLWYDQHNAYWAYGPRVARALNTRYMLSSVSGIGMYRNWNSDEPVMPDVYENMYLNTGGEKKWDFSGFTPDLVSICLGTNDFSDGDGIKERLPFDSARFVNRYIEFVNLVYNKYPQTQVCLLTSPMVNGEKGTLFYNCLLAVQQHFNSKGRSNKPISIYNFSSIVPHGCGYHPDKEDHAKMAEVLIPFYREVMNW
ncbi:SGNH/GDSL hydrolase family protein [Cesiribacter sp. SM1]|uniref:SGNH/GDSL hydrolase family protein n=1 Tax=Cesiribacter sp. SM1 TaxID=2861196 RepID=UPI001CD26348|nr:SGNH/GDSL hydrolase family protein [Cesiribacter sp. SM1]